jgi:hypothetical protein
LIVFKYFFIKNSKNFELKNLILFYYKNFI